MDVHLRFYLHAPHLGERPDSCALGRFAAGMYNYIQPIVACLVAVSLGLDSFNSTKAIAVLLIFGGVYLVTASRSRAEMERFKQKHKTELFLL